MKTNTIRSLSAGLGMAAAIALSGCAGGGGETPMSEPPGAEMSLSDKWQRFDEGSPTLNLSEREAIALANEVAGRRTHTIDGAFYQRIGGEWTRDFPIDGPYPDPFDPFDPDEEIPDPLPEGVSVEPVLEHNGVKMFKVDGDLTLEEEGEQARVISEAYLGYLEYGQFWLARSAICWGTAVGSCNESSLGDFSTLDIASDSQGQYSGANPQGTGSATYTGVMAGIDVTQHEPGTTHLILGEATIDVDDLSNPDVDVAFTGLWDVRAGSARPDMVWSDLPLTNGAFNEGETISGLFYGPAQQEVGGVFDRDDITGAFGAKRD